MHVTKQKQSHPCISAGNLITDPVASELRHQPDEHALEHEVTRLKSNYSANESREVRIETLHLSFVYSSHSGSSNISRPRLVHNFFDSHPSDLSMKESVEWPSGTRVGSIIFSQTLTKR
jgi:hypothetical protein